MLINNPQSSSLIPQSNKNGQDSSSPAHKNSKQKNGAVENGHKLSLKCIRSLGAGYVSGDGRAQQQEVRSSNKIMKKVSKKMEYKKQNPEEQRIKQNQKSSQAQKSIENMLQNIQLDQITLQTANKDEQNLLQQQEKNERKQQKQGNDKNIINVNTNPNTNNQCQQLLLSGLQLTSYSSCLKSMPNLECVGLHNAPSTGSKVNNKYSHRIATVNRDKVGNKDKDKNQMSNTINFLSEISKVQCKLHSDNLTGGTGNRNKMASKNASKKMEIVCLECQKILCAHCVIFGGNKDQNHKKHKVLSIQQFISDIKTMIEFCKDPRIFFLKSKQQQQQKSEAEPTISFVAHTVPIKHGRLNTKLHESYNRDYSKISSQISLIIQKLRQHEAALHKQLDEYYANLNIIYEEDDQNLRQMQSYTRQTGAQILKIIENVNLVNIIVSSESIISMLYTSSNKYNLSVHQIINRLQTQTSNNLPSSSVTVQVKPSVQKQISEMLMLKTGKIDAKQSLTALKQNQTKNQNIKFLHSSAKSNEPVDDSSKLKKRTHFKRLTEVERKQDYREDNIRSNPKLTQSMISKARSVDNFNKPTEAKQNIRNFASPPRPTSNLLYSQKKISKQVGPSSSFKNDAEFSNMSIQSSILLEQESQNIHLSSSILTLTNQNLTDQRLITTLKKYLGSSSNRKQIKSLKLCFNLITDEGFGAAIEFLGNMTNLNLSNNLLTERALDIVLKNKDKLAPLRLLNLRGNKCTKGVHTKSKVQALSKMGVVVCLSD